VRRRALLAFVGTSLTAGCSTVSELFGGERYVGLGGLDVENWDDEAHTVTVQVDAAGETVLDRPLETDAFADSVADGAELPCTWGDTTGPYVGPGPPRVVGRLDRTRARRRHRRTGSRRGVRPRRLSHRR